MRSPHLNPASLQDNGRLESASHWQKTPPFRLLPGLCARENPESLEHARTPRRVPRWPWPIISLSWAATLTRAFASLMPVLILLLTHVSQVARQSCWLIESRRNFARDPGDMEETFPERPVCDTTQTHKDYHFPKSTRRGTLALIL
ncbi:hypothetical protein KC325_g139 [Hortaea werneckii]|nr:hypothetical protein KC325_g139 [Hortaea werneckii]